MSFILDALRKSEHERQRQTGPALAEVAVAPARPRSNVWAPVVVGLLVVNLAVIGVLLIRKAMREPGTPAVAAATQAAATATGAQSATQPAAAPVSNTAATTVAVAPRLSQVPPAPVEAQRVAPAGVLARNPLEAEASGAPPMLDPRMVESAAAAPHGPPAVTRMPASRGSVVYESMPDDAAAEPPAPAYSPAPARSPAGSASAGAGLPSADELVAAGIPVLNLDLHVFASNPSERMVFVNSRKYREGDALQEGPTVRQITPTGAVLDYNGRAYLLTSR